MKKTIYLLTAVMLFTTATLLAQTETKANSEQMKQDVVMVGGNIGNFRSNFQKDANQVQIQLTPRIGWMLRERFMWGVYADFDFQAVQNAQTQIRYGAGLFARAYTGRGGPVGYSKTRLFGEFSSGFGGLNLKVADKSKPNSTVNGLAIGFGGGLAYFPASNVSIELMPRYVFNTGMGSAQARTALSITFGANIYFSKSKAREISKEM
ncbi:MAG TPA: hypothetical protein PLU17_04295 [Chitinophagaceae bacterium]|nr:hypothetical protein [Chitinophagaceae bacterium]